MKKDKRIKNFYLDSKGAKGKRIVSTILILLTVIKNSPYRRRLYFLVLREKSIPEAVILLFNDNDKDKREG